MNIKLDNYKAGDAFPYVDASMFHVVIFEEIDGTEAMTVTRPSECCGTLIDSPDIARIVGRKLNIKRAYALTEDAILGIVALIGTVP